MSSLKERHDKNCLNCNAEVYGKYCHVCGQENTDPKESFWSLSFHFVADIFHYDGKFFRTLKYLFLKPGYLAIEHLRGKRVDYLHPIRLYLFVSAVVFLIIFTFFDPSKSKDKKKVKNMYEIVFDEIQERKKTNEKNLEKLYKKLLNDTTAQESNDDDEKGSPKLKVNVNSGIHISIDSSKDKNNDAARLQKIIKKDSAKLESLKRAEIYLTKNPKETDSARRIYKDEDEYFTYEDYEKVQASKPEDLRDSYFERKVKTLQIKTQQLAEATGKDNGDIISESLLHLVPKILFFTVPLIAFVFFIFYARKNKFSYVNHLIHIIYLMCFSFIAILIVLIMRTSFKSLHIENYKVWFIPIANILFLFYCYKSFRNFYRQSRIKTILKMCLLSIPLLIIFFILTVAAFLTLAIGS